MKIKGFGGRLESQRAAIMKGFPLVRTELVEASEKEALFRASRNRRTFYVYLDLTGEGRHHCSCCDQPLWGRWLPHVIRRAGGMFCTHVAAAAMKGGYEHLLLPMLAH